MYQLSEIPKEKINQLKKRKEEKELEKGFLSLFFFLKIYQWEFRMKRMW